LILNIFWQRQANVANGWYPNRPYGQGLGLSVSLTSIINKTNSWPGKYGFGRAQVTVFHAVAELEVH